MSPHSINGSMKVVRRPGLFDSAHVQVLRTLLAQHTAGEKIKVPTEITDITL